MTKTSPVTEEKAKTNLRILAIASAIGYCAVLVVNALANILPLNGVGTGALSDEIPNLFVPAGFTFSIWGVIYLLLLGYIVFVLREAWSSKVGVPAWNQRDAALFLLNCCANVGWIFAWHWRKTTLSFLIMLVLLASLILLEHENQGKLADGAELGRNRQSMPGVSPWVDRARRFFLTVPLRVYLGWISVATIANVTAVLVKAGWNGFGIDPRVWTVLVIVAGLAVALGFSLGKRQIAAPLVIVWAYAGIVVKRAQTDAGYSLMVWMAALVAGVLILVSIAVAQLLLPDNRKS